MVKGVLVLHAVFARDAVQQKLGNVWPSNK